MVSRGGKANTTVIKITRGLDKAIEKFLTTEAAQLLGFRFKQDVANAAIRQLLEKYGFLELLEDVDRVPS